MITDEDLENHVAPEVASVQKKPLEKDSWSMIYYIIAFAAVAVLVVMLWSALKLASDIDEEQGIE